MLRRKLSRDIRLLTRAAGKPGLITLFDASLVLHLARRPTTLRMAALIERGWVRRIRRGVFLIVSPKVLDPTREIARDTDALAEALFEPCYIGGWTAAAYWDLPSVLRHPTFVVTGARVRRTSVRVERHRYYLVHAPKFKITGPGIVRTHWGARTSGPTRTFVDALATPSWLGGALNLADTLTMLRQSDGWEDRVAEVLAAVGTGAANKRLGALLDAKEIPAPDLRQQVREARTLGVIDLEPGAPRKGPVDPFWRVRMNISLEGWDQPEVDEGVFEDDPLDELDDLDL